MNSSSSAPRDGSLSLPRGNFPVRGQHGFRTTRDYYDHDGAVPPVSLQCEQDGCQHIALQDHYTAAHSQKLCEYHAMLCKRYGAPFTCDIPWTEFYRLRDAAQKQLNKLIVTPVLARAVDAVQRLPGKCYARAAEIEQRSDSIPGYLEYGMSLRDRADPMRFIAHHVAFGIMQNRAIWKPAPGYPRHADKAWLRCVHRSLPKSQKGTRIGLGPYQAMRLRELIAPDLQIVTGRTDYALREAELIGKDVLPRKEALGWFQDSLTQART